MEPAVGCLILLGVMALLFITGGNRYGRRDYLRIFELYTR